ncbi:MAG TPA: hypothetical protein VEA78_09975 [Acidimicrobiales bacterium]|nr:hypothetical protein [Acidimicrobiales bacterium]
MSTTMVVAEAHAARSRVFVGIVVGIQLVVAVVIAVGNGIAKAPDPVTQSVWELPGVLWIRYPLIGAGAAISGMLVNHVVHGITRRQYLRGSAVYGVGICAFVAAVGVLGYAAERLVYGLGGWETDIVNQSVLQMFVTYVLLLGAYVVTGALFAAVYMRFSPYRATLLLLPLLVPMAATEALLATWWVGVALDADRPQPVPFAAGAPLTVVVLALASWALFLLLRDVAIKTKKG